MPINLDGFSLGNDEFAIEEREKPISRDIVNHNLVQLRFEATRKGDRLVIVHEDEGLIYAKGVMVGVPGRVEEWQIVCCGFNAQEAVDHLGQPNSVENVDGSKSWLYSYGDTCVRFGISNNEICSIELFYCGNKLALVSEGLKALSERIGHPEPS